MQKWYCWSMKVSRLNWTNSWVFVSPATTFHNLNTIMPRNINGNRTQSPHVKRETHVSPSIVQTGKITRKQTRSSAVAVIADRTAYGVRYSTILANYQSGFGYKLTKGWYARSDSTHRNSVHSSVTDQSSRSQWMTERNTTSARLIVCQIKQNSRSRFLRLVFSVSFFG